MTDTTTPEKARPNHRHSHSLSLSFSRFDELPPALIPFDSEDEVLTAEDNAREQGFFAFSLYRGTDY